VPSSPGKPRPRGRPRKSIPAGTWIDSDVLARRVTSIVGTRDERHENVAALQRLRRFAERLLGRSLSRVERHTLRTQAVRKREPASVITRTLTAWRHGIGERDVRRMMHTLHAALDERGNDITGQPVLRPDNGVPVLDENGRPATHKPRPRVKLIYR
jgi:hypothetical protein